MQKLVYPEEVEVHYLLPAIRRQLALFLKERGLGHGEIAQLLKISEPSVSHYVKAKRATKVIFSGVEKDEINKSAERLVQNNRPLVEETAHLLHVLKESRFTCKVCTEVTDAPKECVACFQHGVIFHERATN